MLETNINHLKSAESVAMNWAKLFRDTCLDTDSESFDDKPSGFFNTFLALTAQHSAVSFYEQRTLLNEVNPSTAILKRSLMSHLNSTEIESIMATPSTATFAICFNKKRLIEELINVEAMYPDINDQYLLINREAIFNIDGYPSFTLKRNVKIFHRIIQYIENGEKKTRDNIFATYDASDYYGSKVIKLTDPIITTREISVDGERYILLYLDAVQLERKYIEMTVSNKDDVDFTTPYNNNLIGFELYVDEGNDNVKVIDVVPEGSGLLSYYQCMYTLGFKQNVPTVNITFSKDIGGYKPAPTHKLTLVLFTTTGSLGNIEFPKINEESISSLSCNLKQDPSDKRQSVISTIDILVLTKDKSSVGGSDEMGFEDIRRIVVAKNRANKTITSEKQLIELSRLKGFEVLKTRQDIINQNYRLYQFLTDTNYNIVPSVFTDLRIKLDPNYDISNDGTSIDYPYKNIKRVVIKPTDFFTSYSDYYYYNHANSVNVSTIDYIKKKMNINMDFVYQIYSPFNIYVNIGEYIETYVAKINIDEENIPLECRLINTNAEDTIEISNFSIYRNIFDEKENYRTTTSPKDMYFKESYKIVCVATFGNRMTSASLNDIKIKLRIDSAGNGNSILVDASSIELMDSTGYNAYVTFDLVFNENEIDFVHERFKIRSTFGPKTVSDTVELYDYKLDGKTWWTNYPNNSYEPKNDELEFKLSMAVGVFKKTTIVNYENFKIDSQNGSDIQLYETNWLSSDERNMVGGPDDTRYYCLTSYVTDSVSLMKNMTSYMGTHSNLAGVVNSNDVTADEQTDLNNNYVLTVYGVPGIDRSYATAMNYHEVISRLMKYSSDLNSILSYLIDGFGATLGIKRTQGKSKKYKIRNIDPIKSDEPLNSLSLIMELNIKLNTYIGVDTDYVREKIVSTIVSYIDGFNQQYLSFDKLYKIIKDAIPTIDYISMKSFNNYDCWDYQTIVNDTSNVEESLSIMMVPPSDVTEDELNVAKFEPAIKINFIDN